jgi:hypothetical protein
MRNFNLAFDLSTSKVGIALFDEAGQLMELKHLLLKISTKVPKKERLFDKADSFRIFVEEMRDRIQTEYEAQIANVFIEEPLLASNNQFTAMMLQKFNGMCSYILDQVFGVIPEFISVHDARKLFCPELVHLKKRKGKIVEVLSFPKDIDKKEYIWKKVDIAEKDKKIEWVYKNNGELKDESYDMSDSYCVGVAGLKLHKIL